MEKPIVETIIRSLFSWGLLILSLSLIFLVVLITKWMGRKNRKR